MYQQLVANFVSHLLFEIYIFSKHILIVWFCMLKLTMPLASPPPILHIKRKFRYIYIFPIRNLNYSFFRFGTEAKRCVKFRHSTGNASRFRRNSVLFLIIMCVLALGSQIPFVCPAMKWQYKKNNLCHKLFYKNLFPSLLVHA